MNENSQAQVIGRPKMKTWDEYEQGCLDTFGGGHRTDGHLDAFQHGMSTVFNLLRSEFPPAETCKAAEAEIERLQSILTRIASVNGCECDTFEGHKCVLCKVRAMAEEARATT